MSRLEEACKSAEAARQAGREPGLGIVTRPKSNTEFEVFLIPLWEAKQVSGDPDRFRTAFDKQFIISSHRILADYIADLVEELVKNSLVSFDSRWSKKVAKRRVVASELLDLLAAASLPLDADSQSAISWLTATRNVLEHNNGLAESRYVAVSRDPSIVVGDKIPVGIVEVSSALNAAASEARKLNERAVRKWPVLDI